MRLLATRLAARRQRRALGVNLHPERSTETLAFWEDQVDLAVSGGFGWIRGTIRAPGYGTTPRFTTDNNLLYSKLDYAVGKGLKLVLHTGPYDEPGTSGAAANSWWWGTLAEIVAKTLDAYEPHILALESVNEADLFFPYTGWAGLLADRMEELRTLAPGVTILGPSFGSANVAASSSAVAAALGASRPYDHGNLHIYVRGRAPTLADITTINGGLTSYGALAAASNWVTEFGFPTAGANAVTEQQQADYILAQIGYHKQTSTIGRSCVYQLADTASNFEGIVEVDLTPKIAWGAIRAVA